MPMKSNQNSSKKNQVQTAILLTEENALWLDERSTESKRKSGRWVSKSLIIRMILDLLEETDLDLIGVQDEEEIKERIRNAVKDLQPAQSMQNL